MDSLNNLVGLEFLESTDAEQLKKQIKSIQFPVRIIAIYALGGRHYAWIETRANIVKKTKKTSKENLNGNDSKV